MVEKKQVNLKNAVEGRLPTPSRQDAKWRQELGRICGGDGSFTQQVIDRSYRSPWRLGVFAPWRLGVGILLDCFF